MKILRIYKERFDGLVYNFHCLPNENYFSEGLLVHNCYKSNIPNGLNMSFEVFKSILDKMTQSVCQIAFGADARVESNPDLWKMMKYCRSKGIIPNITVAQVTKENADNLVKYCGAVAVSRYANKDICYGSVKMLKDKGLKQVNIHQLAALETYDQILETFNDFKNDSRLKGLGAIVLLALKKVGRGIKYNSIPQNKYTELINFALKNNIRIGMDSCSCRKFLESVKDHANFKDYLLVAEPCESSLFSAYIDVNGVFSACSFTPQKSFRLDATKEDFFKLWFNEEVVSFRQNLIKTKERNRLECRECPVYDI